MKKTEYLYRIGLLLIMAVMALLCGNTVYAVSMELPENLPGTAGTTADTFGYIQEQANGYEKADISSKIVSVLDKDRKVMILLKVDNEWCQVLDSGKTMYVQLKYIKEMPAGDALIKEMEELTQKRANEVEQDIEARKQARRSRIWGIIIAALIAGVFIAGIAAVLRSGDKEEKEGRKAEEQNAETEDLL